MVHPFVLARGYSDSPRFCAIIANKPEFRARPVRACVLTPAAGNGKDLVQILTAIQHTHDLSHTIHHAIKDDMRTCDDRAKARSDLASGPPCEGMLLEYPAGLADLANDPFRSRSSGCPEIVVPDFGKVGVRVRRPDDRPSRIGHASRSIPV